MKAFLARSDDTSKLSSVPLHGNKDQCKIGNTLFHLKKRIPLCQKKSPQNSIAYLKVNDLIIILTQILALLSSKVVIDEYHTEI